MPKKFIKCLCCGKEATLVGEIPATNMFAGIFLDNLLSGGGLYRCEACFLGFRWPRLSKNELNLLYEQGEEFAWSESECLRRDWSLAREWISMLVPKGGDLLDIGCFDGGFLASIINRYKCYGVEIHPQARIRAEQKGVSIIGEDFSDMRGLFDCVTAFDVIEHVENPGLFLSQIHSIVRFGGYVLISTGNLDALTFRLMGAKYWYCAIAEHISFASPKWFFRNAADIGFEIVSIKKFSHSEGSWLNISKQFIANTIYWVSPTLVGLLRKVGFGKANAIKNLNLGQLPPSWRTAQDHFMVLLQKV